jgi:hypothetical protein
MWQAIASYIGLVPVEDSIVAFLAGGSGASNSMERSRVAEQVFPSGHAARTQIAKVAMARSSECTH